jgi:hypothetical protein
MGLCRAGSVKVCRSFASLFRQRMAARGGLAWVSALLAGVLFLASPRKSSQKEGDPRLRGWLRQLPCATRSVRAACETRLRLRQRKPTAPGPSPLLGAPHGDPKGGMAQAAAKLSRWLRSTGKMAKNEGGAALCIPPLPQPRHSRAGGSPGSAWIPACAGMTAPSLNEPHLFSNPNQSANQTIPSHQQVMTAQLFDHGRPTGPLERC